MGRMRRPTEAATVAEPVELDTPPERALVSFCNRPGAFALESTAVHSTYGRYTILGFDPAQTLCVEANSGEDAIGRLVDRAGRLPIAPPDLPVPFAGGWVGFISYEAGLTHDRTAPAAKPGRLLPDLRFSLYDTVAVYEHASRQWYVAGVDWRGTGPAARPGVRDRLSRLVEALRDCPEPTPDDLSRPVCEFPRSSMTRETYLATVARAKQYIQAGDIYEVNLTQRFSTTVGVSALDVYQRLRLANPAWFSAYLAWNDRAVLSVSPELFLDLRAGRVVTRPIKGTRPRTGDASQDARRRAELITSEKDHAELTMIVDLLRNDLGRVGRFGSVRVASAGEIEAHPTVFHRVATVEAKLQNGQSWGDLLRATFPGGSVTGAPKIRAMQIIDELEPTPRDVYCGAIGYIGLDGSMVLNVAIRTMVMCGQSLHLYAGGAIVADSDPEDEYDETLAKAAGMLRALGHDVFAETPDVWNGHACVAMRMPTQAWACHPTRGPRNKV